MGAEFAVIKVSIMKKMDIQLYVAKVYLFKCDLLMKRQIKSASEPLHSSGLKQDCLYSAISQMC